MQYMDINGYSVPYPNDLELQRVPNIVNEITTLTGKVVADVNGWRYGDTELKSISFNSVRVPYNIQKEVTDLENSNMPNKESIIRTLLSAISNNH